MCGLLVYKLSFQALRCIQNSTFHLSKVAKGTCIQHTRNGRGPRTFLPMLTEANPTFITKGLKLIGCFWLLAAGVVWFVWRRHRKVSGKLGGKFPRADDLDRERAKRFPKLKVDRSKVHVVCSDEEWEQVLPQVAGRRAYFCELACQLSA